MPAAPDAGSAAERGGEWHGPRWLLPLECAAIALVFVLDATHHLAVSKTPWLLLVAWMSLRARGVHWRDVGLRRGPAPRRLLYLAVVGGIGLETLQLTVTEPLAAQLVGMAPDLHVLARLEGNARALVVGLLLSWTLAAFGEELVWRGYLLNRLIGLLGRSWAPYSMALVATSVLFGLAHAYQGPAGVLVETVSGLVLGAAYLGCNRNLAVPIAVHGVVDTIDVVLAYLGRLPGT